MKRALFLDIDGVLNSCRTVTLHEGVIALSTHCKKKMLLGDTSPDIGLFDSVAVDFIFNFCRKYSYSIVMSTSWRYSLSLSDFHELFRNHYNVHDVADIIIGATPKWDDSIKCRGDEISAWLQDNPEFTNYIILDDNSDFLDEQKPFFVQTCIRDGLTFDNMNQILVLSGNRPVINVK